VSAPLLEVVDLRVRFETETGPVTAVDGVSFTVEEQSIVGIVGESGSGKSVTMMSVMGLLIDPNARIEGEVRYRGRDLLALKRDEWRQIRGAEIAMIFQDPMTSLHPVLRVGAQIAEQLRAHERLSKAQARDRVVELLQQVGIPDPAQRLNSYPHEFSGGQRQRLMIAMALSCKPKLLIADEPTTALDVTIQAQILDLIRAVARDYGTSVVLITHDLGVVAQWADRISVMYAGRIVEEAGIKPFFAEPLHPYSRGLLGARVDVDADEHYSLNRLSEIPGSVGSAAGETGCSFAPRCPIVVPGCRLAPPPLVAHGERAVACPRVGV
jgi:peptide/nickel transport system ATP-binding protein